MSRLVREELDEQQHGGPLNRFLHRPSVLLATLLLCVGVLVYGLWPLNQEQLYERGAKLMESDSLADMQHAWTDYLEPLERRFPDHPYKDEVNAFRAKLETAKGLQPSEAQRFFQQGELLQKQGNGAAAQQIWRSLIDVFEDVDAEKEWVSRARRALAESEKVGQHKERWTSVDAALDRAKDLEHQGKAAEAERIRAGIEQLYANDPSAADMLLKVKRARQK